MSKDQTKDLLQFLKPFSKEVAALALRTREFIWDQYPNCNELIYDGYTALALGWSVTDKLTHTFCSIAVYARYIHFGFYWGSEIADPEKRLSGNGKQYRYMIIADQKSIPKTYLKKLMKEAYANSLAKVKDGQQLCKGLTIVKSALTKKNRPGSIVAKKK